MNTGFGTIGSILNVPIIPNPVSPISLPVGLIAWWKMDEGSGTTTADSTGNGVTGNLINNPSWISGQNARSSALTFISSSVQYIDAANSTNYADNLSTFSITVWVKLPPSNLNVFPNAIFTKFAGGGGSAGNGWGIYHETNNQIQALIQNGNGANWNGFHYQFSDSNWHLVAMTVTGSTVALYIDGLTNGTVVDNGGTFAGSFSNTGSIRLANDHNGNNWTGSLDDARIYNITLTQPQIATLFSASAA